MMEADKIQSGSDLEEVKIVVNSLYLCMDFLLSEMERASGRQAAITARAALIENLKNGTIDMAIMEDRKTYDFVVSVAEALPIPN